MTGATVTRPGRERWRRRWYRAVVPAMVLGLLAGMTMLARSVEEPNLRVARTLSPIGTDGDGSSELATMLAERGIRIEYVTDIDQAMDAAATGENSVVFIPKPTMFGAVLAGIVPYLPGQHRVVMVAPSGQDLLGAGSSIARGPTRWAATSVEPGCQVPEAVAAGRAAALRSRYAVADPRQVCYDGGLVREELGAGPDPTELFVVGASDPFRNRRIAEHNNAALAMELLATYDRVIWASALPLDLNFQMPELRRPGAPDLPELEAPQRRDVNRSASGGLSGLFFGYPAAVLVALALAAVVALLLALARARRLGAPVSEPLPVLVPAAEVVAGRGRLYQRARARGAALEALRTAALRRVIPALGLPVAPPPEPEVVVAAAAARTGWPQDHVRLALYGPEPETDEQLSHAVAALDALVEQLTREGGTP